MVDSSESKDPYIGIQHYSAGFEDKAFDDITANRKAAEKSQDDLLVYEQAMAQTTAAQRAAAAEGYIDPGMSPAFARVLTEYKGNAPKPVQMTSYTNDSFEADYQARLAAASINADPSITESAILTHGGKDNGGALDINVPKNATVQVRRNKDEDGYEVTLLPRQMQGNVSLEELKTIRTDFRPVTLHMSEEQIARVTFHTPKSGHNDILSEVGRLEDLNIQIVSNGASVRGHGIVLNGQEPTPPEPYVIHTPAPFVPPARRQYTDERVAEGTYYQPQPSIGPASPGLPDPFGDRGPHGYWSSTVYGGQRRDHQHGHGSTGTGHMPPPHNPHNPPATHTPPTTHTPRQHTASPASMETHHHFPPAVHELAAAEVAKLRAMGIGNLSEAGADPQSGLSGGAAKDKDKGLISYS